MFKFAQKRFSSIPRWSTVDPYSLSQKSPHTIQNLVNGKWVDTKEYQKVIDPLNGEHIINSPLAQNNELKQFEDSISQCTKSGLHNPLKNPERYMMWGDMCFKIAQGLKQEEDYFVKLIQRVIPKSDKQARGEVIVTRRFFENFAGDNCRFLCQSFQVPGDYYGQATKGFRWPYGPVCVIAPFNFPLEIPALQLFGAMIVGNRPTLKCDQRVTLVMEQLIRMCIDMGMDPKDLDFINCGNQEMESLIRTDKFRMTQFTGSNQVAKKLLDITNGKVKIENAGLDWKVFGPDVVDFDYAVWQSDQDAYGSTGQKCSAQSLAIVHENWVKQGFFDKIKEQAAKRSLQKGTIAPVITWSNDRIQEHINKVLSIPGAKLLFGGKPLSNHTIPSCYGSWEPTAVFVPLEQIQKHKDITHIELFGPFQIVTQYQDSQLNQVLESIDDHLTAGLVSNDVRWLNHMLANTVNGVTYSGSRARTTGAPQNHWFGPCGDPRAGGIGTKEAILVTWTSHREIVSDIGPLDKNWKMPEPN